MSLRCLYAQAKVDLWRTAGLGVQYRIEYDALEIKLFLQFTTSRSDWLLNFACLPIVIKPYHDQPVPWYAHWGFAEMWQSVRDTTVPEVLGLLDTRRALYIAGISQGGALAVMAHEDFVFSLGPDAMSKVQTFAFAAPRVLWLPRRAIRERFGQLTVIRRRGDIVTMLPPWLWGFRHVGKTVKIGKFALPWWRRHMFEDYEKALDEAQI